MEEQIFRMKNENEMQFSQRFPHKIDPNKIQSVHDVVEILKRIPIYINDDVVKGIEHLIEKENE
ncbi:hypothetical protein COK40_02485 [Bacillus cereus]|uniref:hypothetical protein n=1 Tax=Bacillus cereus TaxID=1396 RepID=UPI000BF32CDE|nr:hypothetical protein [Bacillus cereus]PFR79175.1 hypothetical protein COK40_02485 [Bacillus cereus]